MIYYNTKVKDLNKKALNKLIQGCYKFCCHNMGKKKGIGLTLVETSNKTCYGVYDIEDNSLILFMDTCKSVGMFTRTFIHEWTHSLQPCDKMYNKLLKKYGYDNHPFEIEAVENEKKYNRILLKELREVFGNKK